MYQELRVEKRKEFYKNKPILCTKNKEQKVETRAEFNKNKPILCTKNKEQKKEKNSTRLNLFYLPRIKSRNKNKIQQE